MRAKFRLYVAGLIVLAVGIVGLLEGRSVLVYVLNAVGKLVVINFYSALMVAVMVAAKITDGVGPKRAIVVLSLLAGGSYGAAVTWMLSVMFSRFKGHHVGWSIRIAVFMLLSASITTGLLVFGPSRTVWAMIFLNPAIILVNNLINRHNKSGAASR